MLQSDVFEVSTDHVHIRAFTAFSRPTLVPWSCSSKKWRKRGQLPSTRPTKKHGLLADGNRGITRFGGMTSYSLMFGELMRIVVKLQQVKARSKHPSMIPEMIDWVIDWLTIDGTLQPSNLPWDLPVKPQGGRAFGPQTSPCGRPKRRAPQWDRGGAWTVTVNVGHETFVDRDRELYY